jgi:hypothetical protein
LLPDYVRYYEIAGITVQVESDLPIVDSTFDKKFELFRAGTAGQDTVLLRHHFGFAHLPRGVRRRPVGKAVFSRAPWAIYRVTEEWLYHGLAPGGTSPYMIAVFSSDHAVGDVYHPAGYKRTWLQGHLHSLTTFPTDQIFLARLLADRQGCFLHSSGLIVDGKAFVFVGHSDAGKSTTANLLRTRLPGRAELLCDDRNIIRYWPDGFRGGPPGVYLHGTWSHGDIPDVSSASAPLRAVLFLKQDKDNELLPIVDRKEIWPRLLATLIKPVVTADWWQKEINALDILIENVPCYIMCFDKSGHITRHLESLIA